MEHVAVPHYDPASRTISEYANSGGVTGFVGSLALAVWGGSLLLSAGLVVRANIRRRTPATSATAGFLVFAGVGLLTAAVFATQAIDGRLPPGVVRTESGRVHDLGAGVAELALVAAVASCAFRPRSLGTFARMSAVTLATAVVVGALMLLIVPDARGLRQRQLVGAACVWEITLVSVARRSVR